MATASGEKGSYSLLPTHQPETEPSDRLNVAQSDAKSRFKGQHAIYLLLAAAIGYAIANLHLTRQDNLLHASSLVEDGPDSPFCNPYKHPGFVHFDATVPHNNYWVPIGEYENCTATDWIDLIRNKDPSVEFLRNRSVAIFGDSVDRGNTEQVCVHMGGESFRVMPDHEFSPPLPPGLELPPEDYINPESKKAERVWPSAYLARPVVCHIEHLNLLLVSTFYYGYMEDMTNWLYQIPHFYPPARAEDRFEMVLQRTFANAAEKYSHKPYPDVVSVSGTLWSFMRTAISANEGVHLLPSDAPSDEDWRDPNNLHAPKWYARRTREIVTKVASGWPEAERKPLVRWRSLHHIREAYVSMEQAQALTTVNRDVIHRLAEKAHQAKRAPSSNDDTDYSVFSTLELDTWGDMMMGQERHFHDALHPLPLPGGYLFGNSLFESLRIDLAKRP